tara:strand:- start:1561 stop:2169 length:609 start_codon:yes stop_codon:yes gene_type:complete
MVSSSEPLVIGVTGAMGSGKSTVSGFFEEWGSQLVDADLVAHEFIQKPEILSGIERRFGAGFIQNTGEIRRSALADVVFNSRKSLDVYYGIIKEPLTILLGQKIEEAKHSNKVVVFDAPLLFEWELVEWVDSVVSVYAEREICIKRVMDRNLLSRSKIEDRISLQLDPKIKQSRADYIIENEGSIDDLGKRTKVVWESLQAN